MKPGEKTKNQYVILDVDSLQTDMQIVSYCGFTKKYRQIDQETCDWLQRCFKGAKARIIRADKAYMADIGRLKPGDRVCEIGRFPESLIRLTQVNEKLKRVLKHHGIMRFRIKPDSAVSADARKEISNAVNLVKQQTGRVPKRVENRRKVVRKVNRLVEEVEKGLAVRKEASDTMEEFMDNARAGKIASRRMVSCVESIVRKTSSEALAALASLKQSDQTYSHCIDVGAIFQSCYYRIIEKKAIKSIFPSKEKAMLGAFLHDFGKSMIPKEILDSTMRFSRAGKEMELMEKHPLYGARLLSKMDMPDSIVNMSLCHHVKRDSTITSSYPKKVNFQSVRYETRLLALVDIYQALTGRRKYKRSWTAPSAMRYIDALCGIEFDPDVWNDFLSVLGNYPVGSLVKLNNDCLAFVVNVPEDSINEPQVVIAVNNNGEETNLGTMIDLREERDYHITEDLDPIDVFGNKAIDKFTRIHISQ